MTKKIDDTLARISYFEAKLLKCNTVHAQMRKALDDFSLIQEDVNELACYYSGQDWRYDFEKDEQGLIPKEIRRGILSEDGIYSMLDENRELKELLGIR